MVDDLSQAALEKWYTEIQEHKEVTNGRIAFGAFKFYCPADMNDKREGETEMKLKMMVYDLIAIERSSGVQEHLGVFSTLEKAKAYGWHLVEGGEECWADASSDGLAINGPYELVINPKIKRRKQNEQE